MEGVVKKTTAITNILLRVFVALSLMVSMASATAYAQQLHSFAHEESEDHRQEDVVTNMHFADDVLKNKFIDVYVPYQGRLFKIDHAFRGLVSEYLSAQSNGQVIPGPAARDMLNRGLKLQRERDENLSNYIDELKQALPGGVAMQAWLVENKLRAASASAFLSGVPFVQQ
jgi:hypothetical protein